MQADIGTRRFHGYSLEGVKLLRVSPTGPQPLDAPSRCWVVGEDAHGKHVAGIELFRRFGPLSPEEQAKRALGTLMGCCDCEPLAPGAKITAIPAEHVAAIRPAARTGDRLTFWVLEGAMVAAVVRVDVDVRTGDVTRTSADALLENQDSSERVRRWAPTGSVVIRWAGELPAGVELFWVTFPADGDDDDNGQGVVLVGHQLLSGTDAMRAVLGRGLTDPVSLAACASHLLGRGSAPLVTAPARAQAANVFRVPTRTEDTLEFWTEESPVERPGLKRWRVNLKTLAVESMTAERVIASEATVAAEWRSCTADGDCEVVARVCCACTAEQMLGVAERHAEQARRALSPGGCAGQRCPSMRCPKVRASCALGRCIARNVY